MKTEDLIRLTDQTIIGQISNSNGILSETVNIHNNISEKEQNFFKETIAMLKKQNAKLMDIINKLLSKQD